jgi:hypothetical protein
MGIFVLGLATLVLIAVLIGRSMVRMERRLDSMRRDWLATAEALGLRASGSDDERALSGAVRGVPVRVDFARKIRGSRDSEHDNRYSVETTTFVAGGDGRIPMSLSVRYDDPMGVFARLGDGSGAKTGDEGFDRQVELPTMNAQVCAALSERARQQLTTLVNGGGRVSQGVVSWPFEDVHEQDRQWLIEHVEHVVALAELLSVTPDSLPSRLAHNALHDSTPDVRLRNLRYLVAAETRAPVELLASTARQLLGDRRHDIRFHAACQLGADGHPTLQALAADGAIDSALRAQALGALHEGNAADIDDWIESFLLPGPPALVCAALGVVAARRLSAHTDRVIALTSAADASLRVAATRTLGSLESPPIERCLLQLLAGEETEVQIAAAQALGTVGSVSAVEPLLPLTKGFGRGPLRDAARGAIASIQSRLGDVQAGRLSLVEHDALAGAVALAAAEAPLGGEVTVAADPEVPAHTRRG